VFLMTVDDTGEIYLASVTAAKSAQKKGKNHA
jgi:hypothetical protein